MSYSHHVRTYDFDSDAASNSADWAITTETAVDVLEPLPDKYNLYRAVALGHLRLMLVVDSWMANSTDGVLAWVSCSAVLGLNSTRGRSVPEMALEMGIAESTLRRSIAKFRELAGIGPEGFKYGERPPLM